MALRPKDPTALNKAAITHIQARLGDIAAHRHRAIELLTQAQRTWTRAAHPVDWAMTRFNLGVTFWVRTGLGGSETDGTADLTKAIAQVRASAQVWTEVDYPFYYQNQIAPTLEGLRTAWLDGGHGTAASFEAIAPAP